MLLLMYQYLHNPVASSAFYIEPKVPLYKAFKDVVSALSLLKTKHKFDKVLLCFGQFLISSRLDFFTASNSKLLLVQEDHQLHSMNWLTTVDDGAGIG